MPSPRRTIAVQAAAFRRGLLRWYDARRRELPWRNTTDPYAVWLSEIMLQQTQVATVIPYYERFLARFPTVEHLARAPLDDVLRLWAGLGYYARARNLHRAAKSVIDEHRGRFPDTVDGLRSLPGIGRYTAGAIASIAFGRRAAVVDGNVARVLARVLRLMVDVKSSAGEAQLWDAAESLLPRARVGDFNQALMELGATVCLPGAVAQCGECPIRAHCRAAATGDVASLPIKKAKTLVTNETHVVIVTQRDGRTLLRKRPPDGLWGGLWELPSAVCNGRSNYATARALARDCLGESMRVSRRALADTTHQLSHRIVRFVSFRCEPTNVKAKLDVSRGLRWVENDELDQVGLSTAMRKVVAIARSL